MPVPKSEQEYNAKHPGGRPLLFKTPEELDEKIQEYFAYCDNRMVEVMNKDTGETFFLNKPAPYTMSGLALAVGVDRRTIVNYANKDEFFPTINKARQKVEAQLEEKMMEKEHFSPGQIFVAKNNFGWVDKAEVDHTSKGERMGVIELPSRNVQHNTVPETTGSSQPDSV